MAVKKLLGLVVLGLLFVSSPSKADDISDFQIEGMSVGDSLLDYYISEEIKINEKDYYISPEFVAVRTPLNSKTYDIIEVHYKKDSNYIIHSVDGIFDTENLEACRSKIEKINVEFSKIFKNSKKGEWINEPMFSKDGHLYGYYYLLDDGNWSEISCYKYNENSNGADHGRVSLYTQEFDKWVETVQYKNR